MASNRLSFVIALKFLTENFNRQATRVKSQLYTLQRHFLALASAAGAGAIGLNNFLSKMIETAKKTSQASIALQNVSGNMKAYAENQQWLLGIAKKYGVEINSLTTGFAKFKAAADISNMSMEDQRKIFESVSRATVAFGLSQEDQRGVFMALSQMMSKNKVMAEELRLQLAERMPVAIQAMAKAAGVTVNELDALMKQGKVLSSEVLPKFADALTEMTPNVNLDNLNKSLTDLSNTFTALTKELGVEQAFKSVVDGVNKMLRSVADNAHWIVGVITKAFASFTLVKIGQSVASEYEKAVNAAVQLVNRKDFEEQKHAEASAARKKASATYEAAIEKEKALAVDASEEEKRIARERTARAEKALKKAEVAETKAAERAKRAEVQVTAEVQTMAAAESATGWAKVSNTLKFGLASAVRAVGTAIKAAFSATIWTAALTAVMEIGRRLWDAWQASRELTRQLEGLGKVDISSEIKELEDFYGMLQSDDSNIRAGAMAKINELLGTQLETEEEINKAIQDRRKYLEAEAKLRQAEETIEFVKQQQAGNYSGGAKYSALYSEAIQQRVNALAEMAKYGNRPTATSSTSNISGGGAGTAKIPVISLTIDEDDVAATMEQLQDTIFANEAEAKRKQAFAMQHRGQSILNSTRDTSGDWKLSPTEILEADKIFAEEKVAKLIAFAEETGNDMAVAIQEGIAKAGTLEEAIKGAQLADALKTAQAELSEAKLGLFEGAVDNIDGMVSAISRLNDALEKDSSAWEVLAASVEVFKSLMSGVIETIQSVTALKEASAQAQMLASQKNATAAMGEAMAEGTTSAAKLPFPANIAAIGSVVATILSVFSMIPKFAKGGVVGGNSTQGDKVLARLNSGEGVLTAVGMQSLHDASNPANNRNIRVTGVLVGEGRTLKAIIDKEVKYLTLTK